MEKKKLSIRQRKTIYDKYVKEGASVRALAYDYGVPSATIYNILGDRVKRKKTPRSDKGGERPGYGMHLTPTQKKKLRESDPESDDIVSMLECQAMKLLTKVDKIKTTTTRAKILESISRILKQVATQKLESHLKKADATIASALIREFMPDATDEQVIKKYYEITEKMKVHQ